jgi:replication initiation and membrane attachment protein DnaB
MEKFPTLKNESISTAGSFEVDKLLESISTNFEDLPLKEQVDILLDRIKFYGATVGDTSEPVDNSVRHEAEILAELLTKLKSEVVPESQNYTIS